jgi:putative FmdB family regulatory protein
MPIYEYKCTDCGKHIEKMQRVSDPRPTVCEECGGKLEKQISLSGFQFKGQGWYVTDYSKTSTGGVEKSEKGGSSESTVKSEPASKPSDDKSKPAVKDTAAKKE